MYDKRLLGVAGRRSVAGLVAMAGAVVLLESGAWATHSGVGNHHWVVVGDGQTQVGSTDPSGGSPGFVSTGGVAYNNTQVVSGARRVTSYLDMADAKPGVGATNYWKLKYSGFVSGNFCGADGLNNDTTVATLVPVPNTNANGGTPWGADLSPGLPAQGFLWEVVWGTTPNGTGGTSLGPPATVGSYQTCVTNNAGLEESDTVVNITVY